MTLTEKMAREMNGFFKLIGEDPLLIPKEGEWTSELDLLRTLREQYKSRLLQKMPRYRSLPADAIPDMFLVALNKQENELQSKASSKSNAGPGLRKSKRGLDAVQMKVSSASIYETLHAIYAKHRRKHKENGDSKQMCCMWSTNDPPDIIEGTEPICDIEDAFDIEISDDEALELYDMNLDEAARKIIEIKKGKGQR